MKQIIGEKLLQAIIKAQRAEKEVKLEPEEAYGAVRDDMIKKIPIDKLPQEQKPEKGMMLAIKLPNGQQIPAKIVDVSEKDVSVDLNHPLAGKNLNFKLKVVDIQKKA